YQNIPIKLSKVKFSNLVQYSTSKARITNFKKYFPKKYLSDTQNVCYTLLANHNTKGWIEPKDNQLAYRLFVASAVITFVLLTKTIIYGKINYGMMRLQFSNLLNFLTILASIIIAKKLFHGKGKLFPAMVLVNLVLGYCMYYIYDSNDKNNLIYMYKYTAETEYKFLLFDLGIFIPFSMINHCFLTYYLGSNLIAASAANLLLSLICSTKTDFLIGASTILPFTWVGCFLMVAKRYPISVYSLPFFVVTLLSSISFFHITRRNYLYFKNFSEYPDGKLNIFQMTKRMSCRNNFWLFPCHLLNYLRVFQPNMMPIDRYELIKKKDFNPEL
ncbi:hypothetical protein MXB_1336, partial [Myxobolus squamalis]